MGLEHFEANFLQFQVRNLRIANFFYQGILLGDLSQIFTKGNQKTTKNLQQLHLPNFMDSSKNHGLVEKHVLSGLVSLTISTVFGWEVGWKINTL